MIQSPFLQEVHSCKSIMKKLRKKIYKFNINKPTKINKQDSMISDVLTVLQRRNVPEFLRKQLEKYSEMTFSSLSGFSLNTFRPVSELATLTLNQQEEILQIQENSKRTLKRRRNPISAVKLNKRNTSVGDLIDNSASSTSISDIFDEENNESSCSESNSCGSEEIFGLIGNSNSLDQDYHNSDAMFQSTMLDFGNEIEMDSEEFLFKI